MALFQRNVLHTIPSEYVSDILALGTAGGDAMMRELRDALTARQARWPSLSVAVQEVLGNRCIVRKD